MRAVDWVQSLGRRLRNPDREALFEERGGRRFRFHDLILVHEIHERKRALPIRSCRAGGCGASRHDEAAVSDTTRSVYKNVSLN